MSTAWSEMGVRDSELTGRLYPSQNVSKWLTFQELLRKSWTLPSSGIGVLTQL